MKKIYISLLSFSLISFNILAQTTMQASIGPGPTTVGAVKMEIYLKALRPAAGAVTEQFSTLELNVGVPSGAGVGRYATAPTLSVVSSIFGTAVAWSVEPALDEGGFWNYHIYESALFPAVPFTTNAETAIMEIQLSGGGPIPIVTPENVSLVSQPDGGSTSAMVFYLTGTIGSEGSNLYYSRQSENGFKTTATNGFSYRPTSVNSTTGDFISTATVSLGVVPVKFTGFNVIKKNADAVLTWQVEEETPLTDRYEIERSFNGVDFKKINTLAPKNNGNSRNSYELADLNISSIRSTGVFYYRIKQVDKDGRFITTAIKSLRLTGKSLAVGVYPNPIKNYANVSIDIEQNAEAMIIITDAAGKQVQTIQMQLFKGLNTKRINTEALAGGSYMLKVQTATEMKTIPLVKGSN